MARDSRYWERFDPNFFKERPYRRLIWRYMAGTAAVSVAVIAWGVVRLTHGDVWGSLLIAGGVLGLRGAWSMGSSLLKTRRAVEQGRDVL